MSATNRTRRRFTFRDLALWYVLDLIMAGVAAVIGAGVTVTILQRTHAGCTRDSTGEGAGTWACPDGVGYVIPALVGGGTAALAMIALVMILIARRADAVTIESMSRHIMWLVLFVTLIPGLGWPPLTLLSAHSAYGLRGLVGIVFASVPLIVAYRWRRAFPAVLGLCLLISTAAVALWQKYSATSVRRSSRRWLGNRPCTLVVGQPARQPVPSGRAQRWT